MGCSRCFTDFSLSNSTHPRHESQAPGLGSEVHQADLHRSHNVEAAWRRENQSQPL